MAGFPKIFIVTPSFNQGKCLEKIIISVLEFGYPNFECIKLSVNRSYLKSGN